MMNRKIVCIAVLALTTALSAFAQGDGLGRERMNRSDLLTEAQKSSIKDIQIQCEKETKPLKYKLQELKARQQTLINEDKPDLKAINSNIDEMTKLNNQLAKIKAKKRVDVLSQLTEEQKLLFSERKNGKGKGIKPRGDGMSRRMVCPMR